MKSPKVETIKKVYELLGDDISRDIYINRLMYSFTDDIRFIDKVIRSNPTAKGFLDELDMHQKYAIFGAGIRAEKIKYFYPNMQFVCCIDNYKSGKVKAGLPILSLEEYKRKFAGENIGILVTPRFEWRKVENQLIESGIDFASIYNFARCMERLYDAQYFDLPSIKLSDGGIFIDGGSLNGDDSIKFATKYPNRSVQVWEPNEESIELIRERLNKKNISHSILCMGLSDKKGTAEFKVKEDELSASSVEEKEQGTLLLDTIDAYNTEKVSMIKMDIEGMEYKALNGAKETILRDKPVLAICVYHKPEDIWEIPELIASYGVGYSFYLRHYSLFDNETVLYAYL